MKKIYVIVYCLFMIILSGCSYLPESDPNYRDATYHDFTIGKNYEPFQWKRDNTATFLGVIGDLITGRRKSTW